MTDFRPGVALRAPFSGPKRVTPRNLLLLFVAALPSLFIAAAVRADTVEAVAHGHAVVFNENLSTPSGERHPGSVTWRTVRIKTAGQPDEFVIHADIKIPDMKMTITMDFRRNTDKRLPASHVVEMKFVLPKGVAGGDVISAPGILMKFAERARGVPLAGQSAKIIEGSFLFGLSNVRADRERNLQLLKERGWFDIPMVYASQHRGILAIEKGYYGENIFHDVMAAWEQPH